MKKTPKQLERYFKGVANHHRIHILEVVSKNDGITLEKISEETDISIKTLSEHTKKLVQAGLLNKRYKGRFIAHSLSPYGREFIRFIEKFN